MTAPKTLTTTSRKIDRLWTALSADDRTAFLRHIEIRPQPALLVEADKLFLDNFHPARFRAIPARASDPFRRPAHADEGRFAHYFREVWRRIPVQDRACMLAHWRPAGFQGALNFNPWIQLVDEGSLPNHFIACCANGGRDLKFDAALTRSAYAHRLAHVIAHELAHVYRFANGDRAHLEEALNAPAALLTKGSEHKGLIPRREVAAMRRVYKAEEKETDRVADRWGFPRRRSPWRLWWERA